MKDTARAYQKLASSYDRRWGGYLQETLERAASSIQAGGPFHLLDIGCGTGELIVRLIRRYPQGHFMAVDAAEGMLQEAQRKLGRCPGVSLQAARAEALPFSSETFDWVTSANALHCFQSAPQALQEMARVLKTGGHLFLMDWCRDGWLCRLVNRWCHWTDSSHVWMYTAAEVKGLLSQRDLLLERMERFRVPGPAGFRLWEMMACWAKKG